ncbi:trypsin-like peptidase domain-containing protein [Streptomyces sp. NPDC001941]|uniref:VMAP-C domain-containing protein n=1 Tax=Streptomyces sp. NPDC001941 TaxID=3154659 RepID=UPI003333CE87
MTPDADPLDVAVAAAWVTVHGARSGTPVGAGVYVAERHVLTCAHVLNAALGRPKKGQEPPADEELARVGLSRPAAPGQPLGGPVRLVSWEPPCDDPHSNRWDGDLALVEVAVPGAPVSFGETEPYRTLQTWHGTGAAGTQADVVVKARLGARWLMLNAEDGAFAVHEGFSGAPLWDREQGRAVGVVVSTEDGRPRSYGIAAGRVRAFLAVSGISPRPLGEGVGRREHERRRDLLEAVEDLWEQLTPGRAHRLGRRMAEELGLWHPPVTPAALVEAVLAHPRGGLALAHHTALTPLPADCDPGPLLTALAALGNRRLLLPAEYEELCRELGPAGHRELLAAAARCGCLVGVPLATVPDLSALVEHLEAHRPRDAVTVPHLLRAVEEAAARRGAAGAGLCGWSDTVAGRRGVPAGALEECRDSARDRAASVTGERRPVVRVRLVRAVRPEVYEYEIRAYDEADVQTGGWCADEPAPRDRLCHELAQAVEQLEERVAEVDVEFIVEDGDYERPVDRWPVPSAEAGPRAVGLDRPVVLRGRPMRRTALWQERWRHRDTAGRGPLVLRDREQAEKELPVRPDVACVILCCPVERRAPLVGICRQQGVPVVVWCRGEHGGSEETVLGPLVREDWPRRLLGGVRELRVAAGSDEGHPGANLALVWEDPRWSPAYWQGTLRPLGRAWGLGQGGGAA